MLNIELNTGIPMPMLGLGLYKMNSPEEMTRIIAAAYDEGFRLLDTAAMYQNESELGAALKQLELERDSLFITTKIWDDAQSGDLVKEAFEESLRRLDMPFVDLLLLHWPVREKTAQSWAILEDLHKAGLARAIGVANFLASDIEALKKTARILPAVNQVEVHPRLNQRELVRYCQDQGIVVQAHSTIMRGRLSDNELLNSIGLHYGKSVAQVILRWHLQNKVCVIPKSSRAERLKENFDIFDFALNEVEMAAIDAMNNGERCCKDPQTLDF